MNRLTFLLGASAGALAKWLMAKAGNKTGPPPAAVEPEAEPEQLTPWPQELPHGNTRNYVLKWLHHLVACIGAAAAPIAVPVAEAPVAAPRRAPSLVIMDLLNRFDRPLYWSGYLLLLWMLVDPFMPALLSPELLPRYSVYASTLISVLAPAAVGYWTNYLAIRMLFHPRRRNALWWGLIPARREDLVERIAAGILERLISPEIVSRYLHDSALVPQLVAHSSRVVRETIDDPEFRRDTKGLLYGYVHELVNSPSTREAVRALVAAKINAWTGQTWDEKLAELAKGLWAPKVQQAILEVLPEIPRALDGLFEHWDALLARLPASIEKADPRIEAVLTRLIVEGIHSLNLKAIIGAQLARMDESALEEMLTGPVNRELRFIMTSGGLFGILVGFALSWPWLRIVLVAAGVMLALLYVATVDRTRK